MPEGELAYESTASNLHLLDDVLRRSRRTHWHSNLFEVKRRMNQQDIEQARAKASSEPCPRCGQKTNRSISRDGNGFIVKCLGWGCRAQWREDVKKDTTA